MTISSTSPASPPASLSVTTDTKPPAPPTADTNTPTWQPPAKSPLPPGQGTRIDQLV